MQPRNIPRPQNVAASHSDSGGALFVGSPDPLTSEPDLVQTPRSYTLRTSSGPRPSTPRRRLQEQRPGTTPPVNPGHQWTLFGQLMENEGHLVLTPSSSRSRRDSDPDYFTHGSLSDSSHLPAHAEDPEEPQDLFSDSVHGSLGNPHNNTAPDPTHDYDSDDFSSSTSTRRASSSSWVSWFAWPTIRKPSISLVWRNVFKCAIAYFVASLFTFSPSLSRWIAPVTSGSSTIPSPSGHMVATIAVYFNPAKTVGAMIEADLFCLFGLLYSAFVCLTAMSLYWWLELQPGWEWLGDFVAIAWIGVSMSLLAWLKVWMANPSFNTACSMVAIVIFVVVVKEGGLETLLQVSTITICGSAISNLVCYLIWPQNAISNLQNSIVQTLESFSTLLPMITRIFLLENDTGSHIMDLQKVQRAVEIHQNSFTSLQKNLREAKSEWTLTHSNDEDTDAGEGYNNLSGRRAYEDAVDSLNRLAQHLNGLRSGTRLQQDITKAGLKHRSSSTLNASNLTSNEAHAIDEQVLLSAAAAMFGDLVDELGPPLKALSTASTSTLDQLRNVCLLSRKESHRSMMAAQEFSELVENIEAALVRFESTSNHAVLRLYRRSDIQIQHMTQSMSSISQSSVSQNSVTESDHESVFLVYFFIFTLQEFAQELISLVDAIERIYYYERRILLRGAWWYRLMKWIKETLICLIQPEASELRKRGLNLRRSLSCMITPHRTAQPWFPKVRPHAPDTIQTPPWHTLSLTGKINQTLWSIGKRFGERDTKFAFKTGMAIALLAAPAFIENTRPTFVDFFGDWALISFFVVMSPTIGATNYLGLQRFLGTLFGAAVAMLLYTLFPEDPVALSLLGFVFSIPCFWWAVAKPEYLSASRFVLLTYNLTCLYCYNLRQNDVAVVHVGVHRAIAVTAGILFAALVSRFWWPAEARRELSKSLSEFCLNLGWLYTRLVASNSFSPEYHRDEEHENRVSSRTPRRIQTTRLSNSIQEFMAMELHLQIKLIELQTLLAQAQHEPRLKGPFPVIFYRQILTSLQTILDKLHSMRCVTTREEWYTSVRQDFIVPVNRERRDMVGNIILSFSTLAATFRLKAPLPPYLPPVEESRLRLVEAIRRLDIVKNRDAKASRQLLFFAYALTMKGVTMELESLGRTLQDAFGVIGQSSEEFEMLFVIPESEGRIDHVA